MNIYRMFGFSLFTLVLTTSLAAAAVHDLVIDSQESKVSFLAKGNPGFLKIKGEGGKINGSGNVEGGKVSGIFTVKLDQFDTGIDLRNEHMREKYLEVASYPEARIAIDKQEFKVGNQDLTGVLTLHGVSQPVKINANINQADADTYAVAANFEITLSDYKIEIPSYLGVKVADKVAITVNFTADHKSANAS